MARFVETAVDFDPFAPENESYVAQTGTRRADDAAASSWRQTPVDFDPFEEETQRPTSFVGEVGNAVARGWNRLEQGANVIGAQVGYYSPEDAASNIAANERDIAQYPMSQAEEVGQQAFQNANGFVDSFMALVKNPRVISNVVAESAAMSVPSFVGGAIGGVGGALAGPAGAAAGAAAGVGAGSGLVEYTSSVLDYMRDAGVDTKDEGQIRAALANPDVMAGARSYAAKRGVAVGVFDALTAGLSGGVAGRTVRRTLASGAIEAGGGATGEAAAQLASEGKITSGKDIALEAVGELPGVITDVAPVAAARTMSGRNVIRDPGGADDGATVTVAENQDGVPGGMKRVQLGNGRSKIIGERLLDPAAPQAPRRDPNAIDPNGPPLTADDIASPLPNGDIQRGKAIIEAITKGGPAPAQMPPLQTQAPQPAATAPVGGDWEPLADEQDNPIGWVNRRTGKIQRSEQGDPRAQSSIVQGEPVAAPSPPPAPVAQDRPTVPAAAGNDATGAPPVLTTAPARADTPSPAGDAGRTVTFRTAKGSTYQVHSDGTTSRNKAYRPEHGPDEQGPMPRSQRTVYVTPQDAQKLGEFQARGGGRRTIQVSGGEAAMRYEDGPRAGTYEGRTRAKVQHAPAPGLIPVEIWNDGSRVHFGNEITEVSKAVAAQMSAVPASPEIEAAANEAATSPANDLPEPTQAQKEAGNYRVGRVRIGGMDISIENPKGSERKGVDQDGEPWSVTMPAHYGYIRRTEGADGDHVDVYIGDKPESDRVFVVDQYDAKTGKFDEHKAILGTNSPEEATALYDAGFSDGKGPQRRRGITEMSVADFRAWAESGDTKAPLSTAPAAQISGEGGPETPQAVPAPFTKKGQALIAAKRAQREQGGTWEPVPADGGWTIQKAADAAPAPAKPEEMDATVEPKPQADLKKKVKARREIARRDVGEPDTAITSSGRSVGVRYAVVEADDLVASQDDAGRANAAYPAELQPRDRARGVSRQQISDIAKNLNPRLLDRSPKASDGAPIVSSDGVVESGNGRTLAIRRAYATGAESAKGYRQYLAAQGYPVDGMRRPVLVRVRAGEMDTTERQAFTREANERDTLAMSATEQAMADASAMPDSLLDLYRGGDVDTLANRPFVKAFMQAAIGSAEQAAMVAADGSMSQQAIRRIEAALLGKAFGDADLVAALVESADTNIKAIGGALLDVAAPWAQMRAAARAGDIAPAMDQTLRLLDAVRLVQRARREGRPVGELVGQHDIFSGTTVDPLTEAFLRLMFRNDQTWTKPAGRDKIADDLRFYLDEARKTRDGADLLGQSAPEPIALVNLAKGRQNEQAAKQQPGLDFASPANGSDGQRVRAPGRGQDAGGGEDGKQAGGGKAPGTGRAAAESLKAATPKHTWGSPLPFTPTDDIHKSARDHVLAAGKATGVEHVLIIGDDGELLSNGSGTARLSGWSADVDTELNGVVQKFSAHHNHPANSSLSGGDLGMLVKAPGLRWVWAHGHNGRISGARLTDQFVALRQGAEKNGWDPVYNYLRMLQQVETDMYSAIVVARRSRPGVPADLDAEQDAITTARNIVMHRAGAIEYQDNRTGNPVLGQITEKIENAASELIWTFKQRAASWNDRLTDRIEQPGRLAGVPEGTQSSAADAGGRGSDPESGVADRGQGTRGIRAATQKLGPDAQSKAGSDAGRTPSEPPPISKERRAELRAVATSAYRQVAGSDADVKAPMRIFITSDEMREAAKRSGSEGATEYFGGYYPEEDVARIALTPLGKEEAITDLKETGYHEAFHRLQSRFFTEKELATLQDAAPAIKAFLVRVAPKVADADISPREIEAYAFQVYAAWKAGDRKIKGMVGPTDTGLSAKVRMLWDRLARFIASVRNGLNGKGFQTWEDLFDKAVSGEIAKRGRGSLRADNSSVSPGMSAQAAYHGTPHQFDRFSLDKIGTGEGAQAYGWGLYFAGKKEIAEYYRSKLSGRPTITVGGEELDPYDPLAGQAESGSPALLEKMRPLLHWPDGATKTDGSALPADFFKRNNTWLSMALKSEIDNLIVEASSSRRIQDVLNERIATLNDNLSNYTEDRDRAEFFVSIAILDAVRRLGIGKPREKGRLFHVDIPEETELLDWDAPLSSQPENVADAVDDLVRARLSEDETLWYEQQPSEATGEWLYQSLESALGSPQAASEAIRAAGIPGLRYLDATSRDAGDGTHNYVIFDDSRVNVLSWAQAIRIPNEARQEATGNLFNTEFGAPRRRVAEMLFDRNRSLMQRLKGAVSAEAVGESVDNWRFWFQDLVIDLKKVQGEIAAATGMPIPEIADAYTAHELVESRTGPQLERLHEDMVEPLLRDLTSSPVSMEELESYLYARHAPERNARIAEINPKIPEGGSGMTDAEAAKIMTGFERRGVSDTLAALAERVDAILKFAVDTRVEAGLLSEEQAETWRALYDHYVPLRGFADLDPELSNDRPNVGGSGVTVRGPESRRALGRQSEAADILPHAIAQAQEAIIRAERNRVGQALHTLATSFPNEKFWTVDKVEMKAVWNSKNEQVEYRPVRQLSALEEKHTVTLKIEGKEHRVTFNVKNPRALRLAEGMRKLKGQEFGVIVRWLGSFNRWLSAVNTGFNPEFVITNAFRDAQAAAVNLSKYDMPKIVSGTMKDYRKAMVGSMKGAFGKESGEWGRWYREFTDAGGRTYWNQVDSIKDLRSRLEAQVADMSASRTNPMVAMRRVLRAIGSTVEVVNMGVENAIRLAAFKNARERGMSPQQAASLAKNLTVNFNRRGAAGPVMNAFYLFYNASMQGSFVLLSALKSRRVQKIAAGIVGFSASLTVYNLMASDDDDDGEKVYNKISDFDKQRNMIIMLPNTGGQYIKIPLPYGYNVFATIGRTMTEAVYGRDPLDAAADAAVTALDAFNPIGGSDNLLKLISPTLSDPIVELYSNRDFAGTPIMPENPQYGPGEPAAQRYWSNVPIWAKWTTDTLTSLTGGDNVRPGAIDISPEVLDYALGVVTGAAGSFYGRASDTAMKLFDPTSDLTSNDVPFARRVLGEKPSWYDKAAFYERANEIAQQEAYIKRYQEDGNPAGARDVVRENRSLLLLSPIAKATRKELSAIRKERDKLAKAKERGSIAADGYTRRMNALKEREANALTRFNSAYMDRVGR